MIALDRTSLHKAIDEMSDDEIAEFQALLLVAKHKRTHPGSAWFRAVYDLFEPVRQGVLESGMTEEEVDAIIAQEVESVRQELYEERQKAASLKEPSPHD